MAQYCVPAGRIRLSTFSMPMVVYYVRPDPNHNSYHQLCCCLFAIVTKTMNAVDGHRRWIGNNKNKIQNKSLPDSAQWQHLLVSHSCTSVRVVFYGPYAIYRDMARIHHFIIVWHKPHCADDYFYLLPIKHKSQMTLIRNGLYFITYFIERHLTGSIEQIAIINRLLYPSGPYASASVCIAIEAVHWNR